MITKIHTWCNKIEQQETEQNEKHITDWLVMLNLNPFSIQIVVLMLRHGKKVLNFNCSLKDITKKGSEMSPGMKGREGFE